MAGLGIFVALIGLVTFVLGLWGQASAKAASETATRWPITTATIRTSGVVLDGTSRLSNLIPALDYTYSVDGRAFTGSRICYGYIGTKSRQTAEAMLSRYPAGAVVPLYYDPAMPENSVLEPQRVTSNLIWCIFGGIALILLGVVVAMVR